MPRKGETTMFNAEEEVGDLGATPAPFAVAEGSRPERPRLWHSLQLSLLWLLVVLPVALVITLSFRIILLTVLAGFYIGVVNYLGALYRAR